MSSEIAILLVLILLCIVAAVVTPVFAKSKNIMSVLQRTATTGIVAIGMTFVIGTGGIDLSVAIQAGIDAAVFMVHAVFQPEADAAFQLLLGPLLGLQ